MAADCDFQALEIFEAHFSNLWKCDCFIGEKFAVGIARG